LSERYGINPKTVQKWRKRGSVEDAPMGPKDRRSTVLSSAEEALIVAFRKHTLQPRRNRASSGSRDTAPTMRCQHPGVCRAFPDRA
jgi:hypothetical protein